jgi:ribosomal protein S24E
MEIKVKNESYNPLLKRKEIRLEIEHAGEGTPQRFDLRKKLAAKFGAKVDNVFVRRLDSSTGLQRTLCLLEVYDSADAAKGSVPEYVAIRNLPPDERAKRREAQGKKPAKVKEKPEPKAAKAAEAKPPAKPEAEPPKPKK